PVRLDKVHCGKEPRLAEGIRPGVGHLDFKLIYLMADRELLEVCCRLGKGGRRDFGANSRRGAERRRRSGWRFDGFLCCFTAGSKGCPYDGQRGIYQELPARLRHGFPPRGIIDGKESALRQFNLKSQWRCYGRSGKLPKSVPGSPWNLTSDVARFPNAP